MKPVVCVIDDDQRVREAVCAVLDAAGFVTVQAGDGEVGSKLVREMSPAIVITDIVMPNREGIETIQALRMDFPEMPILAMSGSHGPGKDYLDWAQGVGADDCLAKPFNPAELIRKVTQLIARG